VRDFVPCRHDRTGETTGDTSSLVTALVLPTGPAAERTKRRRTDRAADHTYYRGDTTSDMVRATVGRLVSRLREWWAVEDPEERIDGPGEAYLDPAYNGRYTAERELNRLAAAGEEAEQQGEPSPPDDR